MQNLTNENEHELLTLNELGKILKLKRTAIYAAMKKGLLPAGIRVGAGGQWRWRRSTVVKWLKEQEEDSPSLPSKRMRLKNTASKSSSNTTKKLLGRPTKAEEVKRRREGELE